MKKECVYCDVEGETDLTLKLSVMVPAGTVYPGAQWMCKDRETCFWRIHEKFHNGVRAPECGYCENAGKCWNAFCILTGCDGLHHIDCTAYSWYQKKDTEYCPEHKTFDNCNVSVVFTDYEA